MGRVLTSPRRALSSSGDAASKGCGPGPPTQRTVCTHNPNHHQEPGAQGRGCRGGVEGRRVRATLQLRPADPLSGHCLPLKHKGRFRDDACNKLGDQFRQQPGMETRSLQHRGRCRLCTGGAPGAESPGAAAGGSLGGRGHLSREIQSARGECGLFRDFITVLQSLCPKCHNSVN